MSELSEAGFQIPEHVKRYLRDLGYVLPMDPMDEHIRVWDDWMAARGTFYDYKDSDGFGRNYEVHRRSLHPASRVCAEWASLLLNDKTNVVCENQACTEWLEGFFVETGFMAQAQATISKAFGLGTAAWSVWIDLDKRTVSIRRYDARMVIPLTWDETGIAECAFVTRVFHKGEPVDQLQLHLRDVSALSDEMKLQMRSIGKGSILDVLGLRMKSEQGESYKIATVCFDKHGDVIEPDGIARIVDTGCMTPTFAIVKPALDNTRVDMSPYGQSVFADAIDAIQAVDLAFDAMVNEVDVSKMRIFLSDVLFDREREGGRSVPIPFGKSDCTVFRKVMSTEDTIQEFAPALRTESQMEAMRVALQMLGDLCGFGISYFDFDQKGYVKTATEVSSDNSALMRNIKRHEHVLERALVGICKAVMECARRLGHDIPDEGLVHVSFDDSIITDTAADKAQDMAEVSAGLMGPWEYRCKWYGEDEATAKRKGKELARRGIKLG